MIYYVYNIYLYTHQRPVLNEYLKCKLASVYFCLKNMKNTHSSKSGQCINKLKKQTIVTDSNQRHHLDWKLLSLDRHVNTFVCFISFWAEP